MVWLAKFLHYRGEIDIASRESFIIRKWKNWDSIFLDCSFLGLNFQVIFENFLLEYTVSKRLVKVVKNYDALLCRSTKPISWSLRNIIPLFICYPRTSSIFSGEKKNVLMIRNLPASFTDTNNILLQCLLEKIKQPWRFIIHLKEKFCRSLYILPIS